MDYFGPMRRSIGTQTDDVKIGVDVDNDGAMDVEISYPRGTKRKFPSSNVGDAGISRPRIAAGVVHKVPVRRRVVRGGQKKFSGWRRSRRYRRRWQ